MSKKGILLCGHGTRVKRGEEAFKQFAAKFAQRVPQYEVEPGFLELSKPDFEAGVKRLVAKGVTEIIALPVFLFTGVHIQKDIPCMLYQCEEKHDVSIKLANYIGDCADMVTLSNELIQTAVPAELKEEVDNTLFFGLGVGASKPQANGDLARLTRMVQESNRYAFALNGYCSKMTYPSVTDALSTCGLLPYKNIVVVPYVFFPGVYMDKALALFTEFAENHPDRKVFVSPLLSETNALGDILIKRLKSVEAGEVDLISQVDRTTLENYKPHHHHHHGHDEQACCGHHHH